MTTFIHIGSLVLMIISWIIPAIVIINDKKIKNFLCFPIFSFSACITAIIMQLAEIKHLAGIEDFSAIADTINTVLISCIGFFVITVIFNFSLYAFLKNKKASEKNIK